MKFGERLRGPELLLLWQLGPVPRGAQQAVDAVRHDGRVRLAQVLPEGALERSGRAVLAGLEALRPRRTGLKL